MRESYTANPCCAPSEACIYALSVGRDISVRALDDGSEDAVTELHTRGRNMPDLKPASQPNCKMQKPEAKVNTG